MWPTNNTANRKPQPKSHNLVVKKLQIFLFWDFGLEKKKLRLHQAKFLVELSMPRKNGQIYQVTRNFLENYGFLFKSSSFENMKELQGKKSWQSNVVQNFIKGCLKKVVQKSCPKKLSKIQ